MHGLACRGLLCQWGREMDAASAAARQGAHFCAARGSCALCRSILQVDILSSATEVDEVVSFVRSNAARVLGVDEPQVLPVR